MLATCSQTGGHLSRRRQSREGAGYYGRIWHLEHGATHCDYLCVIISVTLLSAPPTLGNGHHEATNVG